MENEIWKSVVGYEGLYEISSLGRVKRLARVAVDALGRKRPYKDKILVNRIGKQTGYPCVNLSKNGKVATLNIHKLIADAFIPNPDNLPCINHIDENRANSVLSNLERCTYKYNMMYGSAPQKRRASLKRFYETHDVKPKGILYGKSLVVCQFSLNGELIAKFIGGASEVEDKLGFSRATIGECCRHKTHSSHGYVWRYEGDTFSFNRNYNKGKDFSNCKPKSHQKYVILLDDSGNELRRYKSVSEAGRENGFDRHMLSRTPAIGGIVTVNGLRFIVEKKENEYIPKGHKGPRPDLKGKCAKPVCQYTKDGEFVQEFPSATDAADYFGKKLCSDITNCCKKKLKTAYGFIWRYKGEPTPKPFSSDVLKRIEQYDFSGNLVATHQSIRDAIKSIGYGTPTCIGNNLSGRSHSAYGYIWKYAE